MAGIHALPLLVVVPSVPLKVAGRVVVDDRKIGI
jgi:hypothetical protein